MKKLFVLLTLLVFIGVTGFSQGNPAQWRKDGNKTWFKDYGTYNGFGTNTPTHTWQFVGDIYTNATVTGLTGVFAAITLNGTSLATLLGGTVGLADTANDVRLHIIDAAGDLIVGTGNNAVTRLGIGTTGKFLKSNGTTCIWDTIQHAAVDKTGLLTSTDWTTFNTKQAKGDTTADKGLAPYYGTNIALAARVGKSGNDSILGHKLIADSLGLRLKAADGTTWQLHVSPTGVITATKLW